MTTHTIPGTSLQQLPLPIPGWCSYTICNTCQLSVPVLTLALIFLLCTPGAEAQSFSRGSLRPLMGVAHSSTAWGDYDNDNDLDLLLTGETATGEPITTLYRNEGYGRFSVVPTPELPAISNGSVAWGDYDNDGDLDLLLTGYSPEQGVISKIYTNINQNFTELTTARLPGVSGATAAWGDCDNDGDLDLLLTGGLLAVVYLNRGNGTFTELATLPGIENGAAAWGDYDNDNDLDILLTGIPDVFAYGEEFSKIYTNNGDNTFTELIMAELTGVASSAVAWGDYDNDGDLDILLAGGKDGNSYAVTKLYKNNGDGNFTEVPVVLPGVFEGSVAWGDMDNDGDLDILLTGYSEVPDIGGVFTETTKIYRNAGDDIFVAFEARNLPGVATGEGEWVDYDNDNDLDLSLTGYNGFDRVSRIFKNNAGKPNRAPASPTNLSATVQGNRVFFNWSAPRDLKTPTAGLSYNLVVGTSPGDVDQLSPHASVSGGYRRIVGIGNAQQGTDFMLRDLQAGVYYASVQAIDAAFRGSPFSTPVTFTILSEEPASLAPVITGFAPGIAAVGTEVTIRGLNLGETESVSFNGVRVRAFTVRDDSTLIVMVPEGATSGLIKVRSRYGAALSKANLVISACPPPARIHPTAVNLASARLSWEALPGAESYVVRYRVANEPAWKSVVTATNSVELDNLWPGQRYEWQIGTNCRGVTGAPVFSASYTFTTGACTTPVNLQTLEITSGGAALSWNKVEGAQYYVVRYKTAGANSWKTVHVQDRQVILNALLPGKEYEWQVQTHCKSSSLSTSPFSASHLFTTTVEPIGGRKLSGRLSIYPNPSSQLVTVEFDSSHGELVSELTIYDMLGEIVYSKQIRGHVQEQVNISRAGRGVYLTRLVSNGVTYTEKLIID